MERRKFLIGLGSTAAASTALVGSGAFSSVEANREMSVEVADDADAYLGLTSDSHYAVTDNGKLKLDFSSDNATEKGGKGLNKDATTSFTHVFTITNQGTKTVGIQIDRPELSGDGHVHFFVGEQGGATVSDYDRDEMAGELDYDNPSDDARVLKPGDELPVGLYFFNQGATWDGTVDATINALDEDSA